MKKLSILLFFLFTANSAFCQDIGSAIARGWCGSIFKSKAYGCDDLVRSNSVGASFPLFYDAFNLVSAALPTYSTGIGVESFFDQSRFNFALIKGFEILGFGLSSTSTQGTFFSAVNNTQVARREAGVPEVEEAEDYDPNVNFATALNIFGNKGDFLQMTAGASSRYRRNDGNWEHELSTVLKSPFASFSYSYRLLPFQVINQNFIVGLKLGFLNFDYTRILDQENTRTIITQLFSFNFDLGKWQINYALRDQEDPRGQAIIDDLNLLFNTNIEYRDNHAQLGVIYHFSDMLRAGLQTEYVLEKGGSFVFQMLF